MRRTLQTAFYIFKDHPNWGSMRFIALPDLREKLQVMSDLPSFECGKVFEEFTEKFQGQLDLSQISNSNNWFIESLEEEIQQSIDPNIKQIIKSPLS